MYKLIATGLTLIALLLMWMGFRPLSEGYRTLDDTGWVALFREYASLTLRLDARSRQNREYKARQLATIQEYVTAQWNQSFPYVLWSVGVGMAAIFFGTIRQPLHYRIRWSRLPRNYYKPGVLVGFTGGAFGRYVFLPPTTHAVVTAPSGSGKTATLINALLWLRGGVVVTDPKAELYTATSEYRRNMGQEIYVWSAGPSVSAIPLAAMFGGNIQALAALVELVIKRDERSAPFMAVAQQVMGALLLDAEYRGQPAWSTVAATPVGLWEAALGQIASDPRNPGHRYAQNALASARAANFWGSVAGSAAMLMGTIGNLAPGLDAAGAEPVDFANSTIYIMISESNDTELLAARWVLAGLYRAFQTHKSRKPVSWLLDEAGALRLPFLIDIFRMGRGRGLGVVAFTQSVSDLNAAYGDHDAKALLAALNGPVVMYKPHSADQTTINVLLNTIEPFVELAGDPRNTPKHMPRPRQFLHHYIVSGEHGYLLTREMWCAKIEPAPYFANPSCKRAVQRSEAAVRELEYLEPLPTLPRPLPEAAEEPESVDRSATGGGSKRKPKLTGNDSPKLGAKGKALDLGDL